MIKCYFNNALAIIITFDLTSKESFEHLEDWFEVINDTIGADNVVLAIVGNKADLED